MPPPVKFHLDENVTTAIAEALRRRGRDCTTTPQQNMLGASDPEQIAYCRVQHRVIVTCDSDFVRLLANDAEHPGVILWSKPKSIGQIVSDIEVLCITMSSEDFRGTIHYF